MLLALAVVSCGGTRGQASPAPERTQPKIANVACEFDGNRYSSSPAENHCTYARQREQLRRNPVPNPTRLIAGPLLFRLEGTPAPTATSFDQTPQQRYALFFRLDRGPLALGHIAIADVGPPESQVYRADTNCFVFTLHGKGGDSPETTERLERLPLGSRVRVDIQPQSVTGRRQISNIYVRYPRIRSARADDDYREDPSLIIKTPNARRALARIGC